MKILTQPVGRPTNSIRELCREYVFNDQLIEKLVDIAKSTKEQTRDRIRAIELLIDRGYGKADQSIEVTTNDSQRPTTDALIQTMSALRAELDASRKGIAVEKGE